MSNGVNKQRKKFREALLYCLTEEDIQDSIKSLIEISQNTKESTSNRLKAIQMIFDYTTGKPKSPEDNELYKEGDKSIKPVEVIAQNLIKEFEEDDKERVTN